MSIYGGVLSLFVKFSRTKNIKFVNIPTFGKKNRKIWKIEKLLETNVEKLEKKLPNKNDPKMSKNWRKSSPIRMTLSGVSG